VEIHGIANAKSYKWSSFQEYIERSSEELCKKGKKIILDNFRSRDDYKNYADENTRHFRDKKIDEKMSLE
jgi:ribonuclease HIII